MNILDLFAGIGGFSLAAQRAGFEIEKHYASEIDKYAQMIYRRNFNGSVQLGDVTGIGNELGKIDIITGGFPCQAFSIAGKRRGFEDTRGTLFFEIERLCRFYKPSYMVLENVKGLGSHEGGDTIRIILDKLRGLDYSVQLLLLNTKDFGIPQNRERFFFICTARGKRQPEISGIRERKTKTVTDNIEIYKKSGERKNSSIACTLTGGGHSGDNHSDMDYIKQPIKSYQRCFSNQYSEKTEETGTLQASRIDKVPMVTTPVLSTDRVEKRHNGRRFKENGEPSFTLTAQDRHGVLLSDSGQARKREFRKIAPPLRAHDGCGHDNYTFENSIIRRLTPTECERLQDYPDGWTKYGIDETGKEVEISDTQRYKTCGNSITAKVAEEIFKEIKKVY